MALLMNLLSNGAFVARNLVLQTPSVTNKLVSYYSTPSKLNKIVKKLGIEKEPPKRPLNGFSRFFLENRSTIQQDKKNQQEIFSAAGAQWRQLSEDQKEKYNKEHKREQAEYQKLYTAYINQLTPEQKKAISTERKTLKETRKQAAEKKSLKNETDAMGKPKKPLPAFFLFASAMSKNTSKPPKDFKDEWKQLSDENKHAYMLQAQQTRDIYEQELKAWEDKMMTEGKSHLVRKLRFLSKTDTEQKRTRKPKSE